MGSLARMSERLPGFQMESAQSPRSLAKQSDCQFSYAAATISISVDEGESRLLVVLPLKLRAGWMTEEPSWAMRSARLSKRPSQVMTAPDGEMCGWVSQWDSFVVWKARYRIFPPPLVYDSLLSG